MDKRRNRPLTSMQKAFIEEYPLDLKAARAVVRAGYSPKGAKECAARLMRIPRVKSAINAALAERAKRTEVKADLVVRELARLGFANMLDYVRVTPDGDAAVDLTRLDREQAAAITEITSEVFVDGRGDDAERVKRVKLKLADKKGALELLGKHLGLFPYRHEVAGPGGGPIETAGMTPIEVKQRLIWILCDGDAETSRSLAQVLGWPVGSQPGPAD